MLSSELEIRSIRETILQLSKNDGYMDSKTKSIIDFLQLKLIKLCANL